MSTKLINFTQLSLKDKKMVLEWRNSAEIRQWMLEQRPISLTEHLAYIEQLKEQKERLYFLVREDEEAVGVIDFTAIDYKNKSAEIGLYANPSLRGIGKILMRSILEYGFQTLHMKKLYARVFCSNEKAIKLYKSFHFQTYKQDDTLLYMERTNENS